MMDRIVAPKGWVLRTNEAQAPALLCYLPR